MPTGPREPAAPPSGPLPPAPSRPARDAEEGAWITVPGKPYLQVNTITGRFRTNHYQPTTRL